MRILRIELFNLNSLAGRHVIELDRGPLAGAGLFAITGPTGAGKSTILDAITLALYGRAARYGSAPNPEEMMTRHTWECSAEVTFSVPSGVHRAVWQLSRARKRADGTVRPKRYLYNAEGEVLAEKFGDMDRHIESLTGLDSDRFLRSVLLAQGDFARFLRSGPKDRAELLESLTGTAIYSELGMLAHSEFSGRERVLEAKSGSVRGMETLGDEARALIQAELDSARAEADGLSKRMEELKEAKRRAEEQKLAEEAAAALVTAAAELEDRKSGAAPALRGLTAHRMALPFQPALAAADQAAQRADAAKTRHGELRFAADAARAARLSGRAAAVLLARRLENEAGAEITKLEEEALRRDAEAKGYAESLEKSAADEPLGEALPDLFDALAAAETAGRDLREKRAGQLSLAGELGEGGERAKVAAEAARQAAEERARAARLAEEAVTRYKEAFEKGGGDALNRKLDSLRERRAGLGDLLKLLDARGKLEEVRLAGEKERAENLAEQARAVALKEAAAGKAEALRELLAVRTREKEAAARSAALEDHRGSLTDGVPCPLCGALEHPFAQAAPESAAELERAFKKTDAEWRAAAEGLSKATAAVAALEATGTALERRAAAHVEDAAKAAEEVRRLAESLGVDPPESAAAARDLTDAEGKAVRAESDRVTALRETAAQAEKARAEADSKHARLAAEARAAAEGEAALRVRLSQAAASCEEAERARTAVETAADRRLAPFHLTLTGGPSPEELRTLLKDRAARYAGWRKALSETETAAGNARRKASDAQAARSEIQGRILTWEDAPAAVPAEASWRSLQETESALAALDRAADHTAAAAGEAARQEAAARAEADTRAGALELALAGSDFADPAALRAAVLEERAAAKLAALEAELRDLTLTLEERRRANQEHLERLKAAPSPVPGNPAEIENSLSETAAAHGKLMETAAARSAELLKDAATRELRAAREAELAEETKQLRTWRSLHQLIGSADGGKFRAFAQGLSLDALLRRANRHLAGLTDRYVLLRGTGGKLDLVIEDLHQAGARRPAESLSGGESFLASLALALGLSDLAGRNVRIDSLFIDEGFGTLDPDTLDTALCALEALRQTDKTVGVISHVELLKERIGAQVNVEKTESGLSRIRITAG